MNIIMPEHHINPKTGELQSGFATSYQEARDWLNSGKAVVISVKADDDEDIALGKRAMRELNTAPIGIPKISEKGYLNTVVRPKAEWEQ